MSSGPQIADNAISTLVPAIFLPFIKMNFQACDKITRYAFHPKGANQRDPSSLSESAGAWVCFREPILGC
jgi:hypothetical protein